MRKVTLTILTIALVAIGAMLVIGQSTDTDGKTSAEKQGRHGSFGKRGNRGMRGKRGHGGNRGMRGMFRGVDLTDAQKTKMQTIMKNNRESSKTLRDQMRTNQQELRKASDSGSFNESQVTALAQKQGGLHAQMIVQKHKVKAEMFNILTTDQKAKLAEKKAERQKKMEERKAKWAEKRKSKAPAQ